MFGQYPLQVNGFKDLHECLEAAMVEGEIESLHSAENSARSGQEVSDEMRCEYFFLLIWTLNLTCWVHPFLSPLKRCEQVLVSVKS